jgi:Ca-activated chloride channel family protein
MWWSNPWWLLALVLIIPLLAFSGFSLSYRKQAGPSVVREKISVPNPLVKRLTILRAAAIIAVILALAGTYILIPSRSRQLVVLFDTSASIGGIQVEHCRNAALKVINDLNPDDQVALVAFAGQPQVITPWVNPREARIILESALLKSTRPEQTDLQAALRAGYQLLKGKRGNRSILLFSDGHPTTGGAVTKILTEIRNSGIAIDTIPVEIISRGPVARELQLPEIVHPGERVQAQWKVVANQPQKVMAVVKLDGKIIYRAPFSMVKGENTIPLALVSETSGLHRVEVAAEALDGKLIPQSFSGGLLQVSGPARVLVVHGNSVPALSQALSIQGMQVTELKFSQLPDTAEGLDSYGAIVLDNVPALYITENQQNLLQSYVAGGGGLLVIGGDASLGRGDYYATRLEDILPVQTDTRQRLLFPRADILFVIDNSGSMSEMVGKTSKQLAAMQAVAAALKELSPQDEIGILAFDVEPTWVIHFTPVSRRGEIMQAFSGMGEGGGTKMAAAIEEIIHEFSNPGPIRRHVIIITDGLTDPGNFRELTLKLKSLRATITTIGIGHQINEPLLRNMARWGEGQFYRAELDQIPRVIQKETVRITRDLIQEGLFEPMVRTYTPNLSGLEYSLPPVKGYLLTKPKNLATVYLEVGKGDPLLAGWRYGNGQVAVFTSDSGRRWLASWSGTPVYNRLWSQLIRSIERANKNEGLRVSVRAEAAAAQIVVEAVDPDHRLRTGLSLTGLTGSGPDQITFQLKETAMGRYEASVPITGSGIQQFNIYDRQENGWAIGWVWNPPGAEFAAPGPDLTFLGQLSDATGGQLLKISEVAPPKLNWAWMPLNLREWLAVMALLLFLVELGYRSTFLGQFAMARALLASWWAVQVRLAEMFRGPVEPEAAGDKQRNAIAAHHYLAERNRERRVEREDA